MNYGCQSMVLPIKRLLVKHVRDAFRSQKHAEASWRSLYFTGCPDYEKSLAEYEQYYKRYLHGFEKMQLLSTGSILGIRETRRIGCDYTLCLDDFKSRAIFDDEIGRYAYPVDIHASKVGKATYKKFLKEYTEMRYREGESYGVPYRCLVPRRLRNILVAGRCVSTDRYMQSSIRVMPAASSRFMWSSGEVRSQARPAGSASICRSMAGTATRTGVSTSMKPRSRKKPRMAAFTALRNRSTGSSASRHCCDST